MQPGVVPNFFERVKSHLQGHKYSNIFSAVHLFGHSLGGMLALVAEARRPGTFVSMYVFEPNVGEWCACFPCSVSVVSVFGGPSFVQPLFCLQGSQICAPVPGRHMHTSNGMRQDRSHGFDAIWDRHQA